MLLLVAQFLEAIVVDADVVGELVDHRFPDLGREFAGIREVLLERDAVQRDLVRERDEVGAPFRAGVPS